MTVTDKKEGGKQRYHCMAPECAADIVKRSALCIILEGYVCAHLYKEDAINLILRFSLCIHLHQEKVQHSVEPKEQFKPS